MVSTNCVLEAAPPSSDKQIFASSAGIGFSISHQVFSPMYLRSLNPQGHVFEFNIGEALNLTWRMNDHWRSGACKHGNITGLLSRNDVLISQSDKEYHSLQFMFDASAVDTLLETNNFCLRAQCNFEDQFLTETATIIYDELKNGSVAAKIYCESLYVACVVHLATNYSQRNRKIFAPKGKLSSRQLRGVVDYTKSFINTDIGLSEMAASVHLSEFHFARLFRHTLGISPYQFVLQLKIEEAKKLIKKDRRSLSDVTYLLNFSDQAHFSHAFKKIAGISPRDFV
jgi:AraC family transcriptional regulator